MDVLITIIFILICLFILLFVVKKFKRYFGHSTTVKATLTNIYSSVNDCYFIDPGMTIPQTVYFIVFSVDNNNMIFKVSHQVYVYYKIGKKGTLTYKDDRFINFV